MTERILCALRQCLDRAGLLRADASLAAAVSGGGDSTALLYGLYLLRRETPFRLTVCHVQHGLRGESSLRDEQLVRQVCQKLDIPCVVDDAGLNGDMHTPGMETMAREARREIFLGRMESLPADALLTAHHRDDQTETLLMHLVRGAGLNGLGAMRRMQPLGRGLLLRPLLDFSKQELLSWLREHSIPFCHDESNDEALTLRNALRLDILPRLESLSPDAGRRMAQTALSLQQDEDFITHMAYDIYQRALWQWGGLLALKTGPLGEAHPALQVRMLRRLYREGAALAGIALRETELNRETALQAMELAHAHPGESLNLPEGLLLYRGRERLYLLRQGEEPLCPTELPPPLPLKGLTGSFSYGPMTFLIREARREDTFTPGSAWLTPAEAEEALLRFPQPGDIIHPMGAPGKKPLRRFLTDRRIDRPLRPFLPMLFSANEALWVPGICCGESLRRQSAEGFMVITATNAEDCIAIHSDKE